MSETLQAYQELRIHNPISEDENGTWQIARHKDVLQVLKDHTGFSSDVSMVAPEDRGEPSMLFSDAPIHNRLRKLVSYAFKPGHIADQRELITDRCETLMKTMCQSTQVDLVESLAAPLPVTVIAHMLGVEDGNTQQFKLWSDTIFSNIGDILMANPSEEARLASEQMDAYFLSRIDVFRREPQNNLLSRLIETETEDGHLSDPELLSFCRLLLIAGNETTTGLITGIVRVFDEIPEAFGQLKANRDLIPTFIEETLRLHSPFSVTIRKTKKPCVIGDTEIPKGVMVTPMIACANRDETVFDDPEKFIIDRSPNPHLAFGFGAHNCLGAHLARLEGEIAIHSMLDHLEGISLANSGDFEDGELGGPSKLLVNLNPAK